MDIYIPAVIQGCSTDDALSFFQYVNCYATFKQMNDSEKLQFSSMLLRVTASDFYTALPSNNSESWTASKQLSWHSLAVLRLSVGMTPVTFTQCYRTST